jgi:hypothetical protein
MKNLIKWLSAKQWIYKLAVKLIANRIIHGLNRLTPEYLQSKGWIQEGKYWVEPNSLEWFENYYLLAHGDNGIYDLAGI